MTGTQHCWEDGPDHSTCMLQDGHSGNHEFTPDSHIEIAFQLAAYTNVPAADTEVWS